MKNNIVLLAVLIALASIAIPQIEAAEPSEWAGIDLTIRFFDRRIYHAEGDPIYIQLTITNNSPSTYRFKLADERAFSLDFDVRTVSNRSLEAADSLIQKRTQYQRVFFREMAIESGESFSFVEDLRSYIKLTQPGSLVVRARIYPELFRTDLIKTAAINGNPPAAGATLESQRLSLNIRPAVITGDNGVPVEMDVETGAQLVRSQLGPDKVVEYMISARQKSQWERFFLYLDVEAMLVRDSVRQRRWLAESEQGRRRMVAQYRQELQTTESDSISYIPTSFMIERTQYNNTEGSVTVLQKYKNHRFTELKRYTYYLRMQDNIWTIIDYSVDNLGTE